MKEDEEKMKQKEAEITKPVVVHVSDESVKKTAAEQFDKYRETFRKLAKR